MYHDFFFKANFPFHLTNTFSLQHLKTYYLFKNRKWNSWSELFIDSYMEIKLLNLRLGLEATVTHHHVFSVFSFHFLSPLWSPCLCRFAKKEPRLSLCSAWHDGRCGSGLPSRAKSPGPKLQGQWRPFWWSPSTAAEEVTVCAPGFFSTGQWLSLFPLPSQLLVLLCVKPRSHTQTENPKQDFLSQADFCGWKKYI